MAQSKLVRGLGTRAIHAGQKPDPSTGAVMTPIYGESEVTGERVRTGMRRVGVVIVDYVEPNFCAGTSWPSPATASTTASSSPRPWPCPSCRPPSRWRSRA